MALEDRPHLVVVAAHRRAQRLRVGAIAERRRAGEVAEDDRDDLAHLTRGRSAPRARRRSPAEPEAGRTLIPARGAAHGESTAIGWRRGPDPRARREREHLHAARAARRADRHRPLRALDGAAATSPAGTSRSGSACRPTRSRTCARRSTGTCASAAARRARGRSGRTRRRSTSSSGCYALGLVDDEPTALAIGMVLTASRRRRRPASRFAASESARGTCTPPSGSPRSRSAARRRRAPPPRADDPNNVVYLAYVDGEPVARASASFGEHGVDAVRRRDAAGGPRPRRLSRARRRALGRRGRARHAGASSRRRDRCRGRSSSSSASRGLRDPDPGRRVRHGRMRRVRVREGRLRDPGGGRAGRRGRRAGEGRADRAGAGDPGELPREHPRRPPQRRDRRSRRGAEGGYWLARPADEISAGRHDPRRRRTACERARRALGAGHATRAVRRSCATCGSPCARACAACSST